MVNKDEYNADPCFLPRDAMYNRVLCRRAVSILSERLTRSCILSMSEHILKLCSPSARPPF